MWAANEIPIDFQDSAKLEELVRDSIQSFEYGATESPSIEQLHPATLSALYAFAHRFYQDGLYEKACDFFRFLSLLQPIEQRNWMGLGASQLMCQRYSPALQAYAYATALNTSDPRPHFHAAECYAGLEQWNEAHKALAASETFLDTSPASKRLQARMVLLRRKWPEPTESSHNV